MKMIYKEQIYRENYNTDEKKYDETVIKEYIYTTTAERAVHIEMMQAAGYKVMGPPCYNFGSPKVPKWKAYAMFSKTEQITIPDTELVSVKTAVLSERTVTDFDSALKDFIVELEKRKVPEVDIEAETQRIVGDLLKCKPIKKDSEECKAVAKKVISCSLETIYKDAVQQLSAVGI